MRKALAVTTGVAMLVLGLAPSAAADPKHGEVFELQCDNGLGTVSIVTFGNGQYTPGLVRTSTRVLTPYAFDLTGTFTPSDGSDPESFEESTAKHGPAHGRTAACTLHAEFSDQFGTAVVDGTVWVAYTPAH